MKRIIFGILALVVFASSAVAGPIEAQTSRTKFTSTNVSTSAYTQIISSTTKTLRAVTVLNTCANTPLQLALGAAGSETVQITIPANMSNAVTIPLTAPYASRISVIALDTTATTGELQVNAVY